MSIFDDIGGAIRVTAGTALSVAVAPIAFALGVSEAAVRAAIKAGCETVEEIREWINENWR